jgi:hypothetical protein
VPVFFVFVTGAITADASISCFLAPTGVPASPAGGLFAGKCSEIAQILQIFPILLTV